MKRSLVISGGGAKGAFAAGLTNKLYDKGYRWKNFYGTSTGSLLNLLISQNRFDELKNIYTSVNNKDIFNKPPFTQRGRLNIPRTIWRLLTGKKSIGVADNLFNLIQKTYTEKDHNEVLKTGKSICSCVTNYSLGCVAYAYNTYEDYEDFIKFVFASASVPIAMEPVLINGYEYLDGGVMEHIPLQEAINEESDEIDVIVLRPDFSDLYENWESKNTVNVSLRTIELMMREISETDLIIGKLKNTYGKNIKINIFYADVNGNSLVFDPRTMFYWWHDGYNTDIDDYEENTLKSGGISINKITL